MTRIHIVRGELRIPAGWDSWLYDERLYKRVRGRVFVQGRFGWGLVISREEESCAPSD